MSIRMRLTLLFSTILALALIAFSTTLFVSQTRTTYMGIESALRRQAFMASRTGRPFPGPEGAPALPDGPPGERPNAGLFGDTLPGRWTQTRSNAGVVLARSFDLSDNSLPLSEPGLKAVLGGSGWFETAQVEDQPLLIYSESYSTAEGVQQIMQVAFPISQPIQALNTLRLMLVAGSSLAIMAAFAVGWVLAGTALGPIHRITQTAQAIGAEHNFSRRVDHRGPKDEVGQLAVTFNTMLAELEAAYRQLEGALDSQHRFVADASHELRTPLTTVRGNLALLEREPTLDPAERADILADTTSEVERLIRLVNQLLVLARADAGQKLRTTQVPVRPVLEDVYRQAKLLAPDSTISCRTQSDATVLCDRDALKQVLLVLLDNAITHGAPGTAIELSAGAFDRGGTISVRDSGPGIPPEALPHIFERFYRGEVSRRGPGTGLGLAIAKGLVEAQGGRLLVESEPGRGSVFTVVLPQASDEGEPVAVS